LPVLGTAARSADRAMILQALQGLAAANVPAAEALALVAGIVPTRAGRAELKAEAERLAGGASVESGDPGGLLSVSTRRALGRAWAAHESGVSLDRLARAESARGLRVTNRHLAGLEPYSLLLTGAVTGFSLFAALLPIIEFGRIVQGNLP
jgi:type II secretory pathway component PulF